MTIPHFTPDGFLPPIRPGATAIAFDRSPYQASTAEVARAFATTEERRVIFRGFLTLRADLRGLGFASGFHWLDGSFVEDCERLHLRAPGDIDVVSFLSFSEVVDTSTPAALIAFLQANAEIFKSQQSKVKYGVDHYPMELGGPLDGARVKLISYWYSIWSHRRDDQRWKGFVRVDLGEDDTSALAILEHASAAAATDHASRETRHEI